LGDIVKLQNDFESKRTIKIRRHFVDKTDENVGILVEMRREEIYLGLCRIKMLPLICGCM
jgi:hypothetical protein